MKLFEYENKLRKAMPRRLKDCVLIREEVSIIHENLVCFRGEKSDPAVQSDLPRTAAEAGADDPSKI